MTTRVTRWLITAAFVSLASVAFAQAPERLTYDIHMESALQMGHSTYVLPPGDYRLEQFSETSPNLFVLREKDMAGHLSKPLAILDAWHVPYYDGPDVTAVKLVTDPEAGGVAVITGWQIGPDYWRLRDVATLDSQYFTAR